MILMVHLDWLIIKMNCISGLNWDKTVSKSKMTSQVVQISLTSDTICQNAQKPHLTSILWLLIMNLQFHPVQDYPTLPYKIRDKLGCHTECWTRMVYPLNL